MRLVLLEPRLVDIGSHHLPWTLNLAGAAQERGWTVRVVGSFDMSDAARRALEQAGIDAHAGFPLHRQPLPVRWVKWLSSARWFRNALRRELALCARSQDPAVLLCGSSTAGYLVGAATLRPRPGSHIVLQFFDFEFEPKMSRVPREALRLAAALARRAQASGHVRVAGQSATIAERVSRQTGCDAIALPMGMLPPTHPASQIPDRLVVGTLGSLRADKGFALLGDALIRMGDNRTFDVRLQAHVRSGDPPLPDGMLDRLRSMPGVQIEDRALAAADYESFAARIDVMVAPYDPDAFRHRTSGIFSEAVARGQAIVVPADTWMAREAKRLGVGHVFSPHSSQALEQTIRNAVETFEQTHAARLEAAATWRREHSESALVTILEELAR